MWIHPLTILDLSLAGIALGMTLFQLLLGRILAHQQARLWSALVTACAVPVSLALAACTLAPSAHSSLHAGRIGMVAAVIVVWCMHELILQQDPEIPHLRRWQRTAVAGLLVSIAFAANVVQPGAGGQAQALALGRSYVPVRLAGPGVVVAGAVVLVAVATIGLVGVRVRRRPRWAWPALGLTLAVCTWLHDFVVTLLALPSVGFLSGVGLVLLGMMLSVYELDRLASRVHRAERTQRLVRADVQALTAAVHDGVLLVDASDRLGDLRGRARQTLGLGAEDPRGVSLLELLAPPPQRVAELRRALDQARAGGLVEIDSLHTRGRVLRLSLVPVEHRSEVAIILRDLTDELRDRAALRQSRRNLVGMLRGAPLIVLVHRERRLIYLSPAARALLGVSEEEQLPELPTVAERAPEEDLSTDSLAWWLRARDGGRRLARGPSLELIFDDEPARAELLVDLTGERRLRARLEHAERLAAAGEVAAAVAHELNNPLASALSSLQIAGELQPGPALEPILADARRAVEQVAAIVSEVGGLSQLDGRPGQMTVTDIVSSVRTVAGASLASWVALDHQLSPNTGTLQLPRALVHVLLTLVLRSGGRQGQASQRLLIRSECRGEELWLELHDSLPRLSPAEDPFEALVRSGPRSGLHLRICRDMLRSLGGELTVHARPDGASIRLVMPLQAEAEADAAAEAAAPVRREGMSGRARILVVDDNEMVAGSVRRVLRGRHEVEVELSPVAALERLQAGERYDLILCDVMMPRMSGPELYERLVEHAPAQARRLCFLSGGSYASEEATALSRSGRPVLAKPFDVVELRDQVAGWLAEGAEESPARGGLSVGAALG